MIMILVALFLIKKAVLHLTLDLHFLLLVNPILYFLASTVFLVESFSKVCKLDRNHEIKHEKGSEEDTENEEKVRSFAPCRFTHYVHHIGPSFKGDDLKDVETRAQDVIKAKSVTDWVLIFPTSAINAHGLPIDAISGIHHAKNLIFLLSEQVRINTIVIDSKASILKLSSEKLSGNRSKHDQHKSEKDQDIKEHWHRVQNCRDQSAHSWHGVDGSERSEDSDNSD
jgi:hypothetical protein